MKQKHTHKYKKTYIGKVKDYEIFQCMLPNCTHYIAADLILGKSSICWACLKEFQLTTILIQRVRPTCSECRINRGKEAFKKAGIEIPDTKDILKTLTALGLDTLEEVEDLEEEASSPFTEKVETK